MACIRLLKYSNTFVNMIRSLVILIISVCLTGCLGGVWTGASMVYDRHSVYKKMNDYHLSAEVNHVLFADKKLREAGCSLDVAVFNGDVLLVGHVPTMDQLNEVKRRLQPIYGYRRIYNEISLNEQPLNNSQDSWITTKIRSEIFADDSIDPNAFKIVTADSVVYLMGEVRTDQAEKVINIARNQTGVLRVVKLMTYFTYQAK